MFDAFGQIGWAIAAFGSIMFWQIAAQADYSFLHRGELLHAAGVVTSVEKTDARENKRPIYAHHYAFSAGGRTYAGTSYAIGEQASAGASVDVEYSREDPAQSNIAGMRRKKFGPWSALLVIIPLIGLFIATRAMRRGSMRAALLRDGILAGAKFEGMQATNVRQNRRTVYLLTFVFTARDGRKYSVNARSTDTGKFRDEPTETVLYDPQNPDRAFLIDELPSRPEIDESGELRGSTAAAMTRLILPLAVVAGNLLAI